MITTFFKISLAFRIWFGEYGRCSIMFLHRCDECHLWCCWKNYSPLIS